MKNNEISPSIPPGRNPAPNQYRPDKPKSHIPQFSIASKVPTRGESIKSS